MNTNAMRRSRLFVRVRDPSQLAQTRETCQRVIDGMGNAQLRITGTLPDADFAIEHDGCQHGLLYCLLALMPLVDPATNFRLGPLCARCREPELCKIKGTELLRSCEPWLYALLSDDLPEEGAES